MFVQIDASSILFAALNIVIDGMIIFLVGHYIKKSKAKKAEKERS